VGKAHGESLWQRARGVDASPVTVPGRPQSVSREETFARDLTARAPLRGRIAELAADVGGRLRRGGWAGRTVNLKLRYSDFTTLSRQHSLPGPTQADTVIRDVAGELFEGCWSGGPVRLLGVGVSQLEAAEQMELFESQAASRLDAALDSLRRRFGDRAIQRGPQRGLRDLDWRGDDLRRLAR